MSAPIVLDVFGVPQPQGSKTAIVRHGRAVVIEGRGTTGREAFRSWREAVAQAGRDYQASNGGVLLDEPLAVTCAFRLPRPKSAPKKRLYPASRPDLDKLARSVADALTGVIWRDDSLVVTFTLTKRYAYDDQTPGARITIEAVL